MPDSPSLRDTIAQALKTWVTTWGDDGLPIISSRSDEELATNAIAAIQGYAGRGAAERLEAAHLLFGTDNVREGWLWHEDGPDSWSVCSYGRVPQHHTGPTKRALVVAGSDTAKEQTHA